MNATRRRALLGWLLWAKGALEVTNAGVALLFVALGAAVNQVMPGVGFDPSLLSVAGGSAFAVLACGLVAMRLGGQLRRSASRQAFLAGAVVALLGAALPLGLPLAALFALSALWGGKEPRAIASEPGKLHFAELPPIREGSTLVAETELALSHLGGKKDDGFVSVVTLLSVLGVMVGVMVLNMVLPVMTGFEIDLRDKILGANAHVVVLKPGGSMEDVAQHLAEVESVPGVTAVAPFVYSELLLRSAWGSTGVIAKGLDVERTGDVTSIRDDLRWGPQGELLTDAERRELFAAFAEPIPAPEADGQALPGIFVGTGLRDSLNVRPGDVVQLINPLGTSSGPMGMPVPQVRPLRVAGVFDSGMYEYDAKWAYVTNHTAQQFLKLGDRVTGLEVAVEPINDAASIAVDIEETIGFPFFARHWEQQNQALFDALRMEKVVMGLILGMIVVVAALLIVTTLIMLVITKGREIAILKAMGASRGMILRVFMLEGSLIGVVGTTLGTIYGLIGCWFLDKLQFHLDTDVYYLDTLPVVVQTPVIVFVAGGAVLLCFLATIYPATRAAVIDPVEGLRYE